MEAGRGEEMAGKWYPSSKRGVGSEGGSDELQMLSECENERPQGNMAKSRNWHEVRPGREVGEL